MRRREIYGSLIRPIDINKYMTIEALEDGLTVKLTGAVALFCVDGDGDWKELSDGIESHSINKGQTMSFKGKLSSSQKWESGRGYFGSVNFKISKNCNLLGNCMALRYLDSADQYDTAPSTVFCELFADNSTIIEVSDNFLPAIKVQSGAYRGMFAGCKNLIKAPKLPATSIAAGCYGKHSSGSGSGLGGRGMFQGCTSLTEAPELPATVLAETCYSSMFQSCSSLVKAPRLPALSAPWGCYSGMFAFCTSLVIPPELPATTISSNCYGDWGYWSSYSNGGYTYMHGNYGMFEGCTSLEFAPDLPALYLADRCYDSMFDGCTSLKKAAVYAIHTAGLSCNSMFQGCQSLKEVTIMAYKFAQLGGIGIPSRSSNDLGYLINNPITNNYSGGSNWKLPSEIVCNDLQITADDVDGNKIKTTLHIKVNFDAIFDDGTRRSNISTEAHIDSPEFEQNTSNETIVRTFEYSLGGITVIYKINHLRFKDYNIVCTYDVDSTTADTTLLYNSYISSENCEYMIVDGIEMPVATSYKFDTTGIHSVIFKIKDDACIKGTYQLFYRTKVKSVDFREVPFVHSIEYNNLTDYRWESTFTFCTKLEEVYYPETVKYISDAFMDYSNTVYTLTKLAVRSKIAPDFYYGGIRSTKTTKSKKLIVPINSTGYDEGSWSSLQTRASGYYYNVFTKTHLYAPEECLELDIQVLPLIGNATRAEVKFVAKTNGTDTLIGEKITNYEVVGTGLSEPFEQNTSNETIQREVTFNYFGMSKTVTVDQMPMGNPSYTVNLNNQWQLATSSYGENPDPDNFEGTYESYSNYGKKEAATMYIDIVDLTSFKLYIKSYCGSDACVVVSQLDKTIDNSTVTSDSELVKDFTEANSFCNTSVSDLDGYKLVEFNNISMGSHRITVIYKKSSTSKNNTDKGYILIPKQQYY